MINHKQKLALEILWAQHKVRIVASATRYEIHPSILVALVGAYAQLSSSGYFSPSTAWRERGWISDELTPDRARYGYTQIRLSLAQSLKLDIDVNRKTLCTPYKCFMITSMILSYKDYIQPSAVLEYWHGAEVPNSLRYKYQGSLAYFNRTLLDSDQLSNREALHS